MNSFANTMIQQMYNTKKTENGATAHRTTNSVVYDMFAIGGAIRNRTKEDIILMFKNAYEEDPLLAAKCLFYLGDRLGQGERRFFRICFSWLVNNYPEHAMELIPFVPEYRRWDDLIYTTIDNDEVWEYTVKLIDSQLSDDIMTTHPSLLAKWLPSENASSQKTRQAAKKVRESLDLSARSYRKMLSNLRKSLKVVEKDMSENNWDNIEFDKLPSKAGMIYSSAFARRDETKQRYFDFINNKKSKVNAATLYPYEIISKLRTNKISAEVGEKYWENLPNYFEKNSDANILCMIDTSGSMTQTGASYSPLDVAISLGIYCAERMTGPLANYYLSFASNPKLVKVEGINLKDKITRIYNNMINDSTNLVKAFDQLLSIAKGCVSADIPSTLIVVSDMEIDESCGNADYITSEMEQQHEKWANYGFKMPKLVYWNVAARNNTILDLSENVTYVSGCSPVTFQSVLSNETSYELMLKTLFSKRYLYIA